jgi:hypothetical protein
MCISCSLHCFIGCGSFGFKFEFKIQKQLNLQFYLSFFLSLSLSGRPISLFSPFFFFSFPARPGPWPLFLFPSSPLLFFSFPPLQPGPASSLFPALHHAARLPSPPLFFPPRTAHTPRPSPPAPPSPFPFSLAGGWPLPVGVVPNLEPGSGSRPDRTQRHRPPSASGPHAQAPPRPPIRAAQTLGVFPQAAAASHP